MPRRFFVGGNWKCNGNRDSIQTLSEALNKGNSVAGTGVEVVVAPPAAYADYTRSVVCIRRVSVRSLIPWVLDAPGRWPGPLPSSVWSQQSGGGKQGNSVGTTDEGKGV